MNNRFFVALAAAAALPLAAVAIAQGPAKITPGQWETTTEIVDFQMQGMPANVPQAMLQNFKPKPVTVRSCVTPQQAANPKAEMMAAQRDGNCKVGKFDMAGGAIAIAMTCSGAQQGGKADIAMTGRYTPTSYTMDGAMKMDGQGGMKMTMKSRTMGKHIGACKS